MSIVVNIEDKQAKKGYIGIDIDNGLIQFKQSMNGAVLRTFDSKDTNVYTDISDKNRMAGVFNDLRVLAGLALNSKVDSDKRVRELKKQLGDQRLLYDVLYSEYTNMCENYLRLRERIENKEEPEPEAEYNWWEQYT